jgi:cytochrome c peroxidase
MKTTRALASILLLVFAVSFTGCKKEESSEPPSPEEATNAPVLPERTYDYPNSNNDSLAELGRVLFYDKNLSLNNSVACANCHQQARAFCDNQQFSTGLEDQKTPRNSPSIFAKQGSLFWDARANNMSELVFMPVQNHVEMKFSDISELAKKIGRIDYYKPLFRRVFRTEYVEEDQIRSAMTEFLHNFNFSHNKFSRTLVNAEKLNASEQNGHDIFFGKGRCSNCHHLTDPNGGNSGSGYGVVTPNLVFNIGLDYKYTDKGVGERTGTPEDEGKFLIPVLLNVEYTAPYMHDGRFKTLDEVVEHYNSGIKDHGNLDFNLRDFSALGNLSQFELIQQLDKNHNGQIDASEASAYPPARLGLTANEKRNLVDFLKTLSDPSILNDVKYGDPFSKN